MSDPEEPTVEDTTTEVSLDDDGGDLEAEMFGKDDEADRYKTAKQPIRRPD